MEFSILIAKILAITYLSLGLGILFNMEYYKKVMKQYLDNSVLIMLGGIMALVAGFVIIMYQNGWSDDWTILITIIGWIALLKGILLLIYPKYLNGFNWIIKKTKLIAILVILLGFVFGYFGFMA